MCAELWADDASLGSGFLIEATFTTMRLAEVVITFSSDGTASADPHIPAKNPFWVKAAEVPVVSNAFTGYHGLEYDNSPYAGLNARSVLIFDPTSILTIVDEIEVESDSS